MSDKSEYITREIHELTLGAINDKLGQLVEQVEKIEAVNSRVLILEKELEHDKERLRRLESNQSKIAWTVGSAIVVAIVNFIIQGGLRK